MKITPYDSPLRFMVTSDSDPTTAHLVDLGENKGFGKCGCQHFDFRIQPELDKGNPAPRCKHLTAAREHLTNLVIAKLKTP